MLPKNVQKAINQQIQKELYSAYYYLAIAAHFESANFPGFAHWMTLQYKEETAHAMKLYKYIHERGGKVVLEAIEKPPTDYKSPLEVFGHVLEHEKKVTASITALYEVAMKEKDYPTQIMLEWFIKEQVEEEKNAGDAVNMLEMAGDAPAALFMLDRQMGSRAGE